VAVCNDISLLAQNRRAVTVLAGAARKLRGTRPAPRKRQSFASLLAVRPRYAIGVGRDPSNAAAAPMGV